MTVPTTPTLALRAQRVQPIWFRTIECGLSRIARRRWLSIILVGVLALAGSATLSLRGRMPEPDITDEFSYLLGGDTFAYGRLTNPTHPLSPHFESFGIIQQPTYASKFPPAQGLILAAGQVFGGHPIVGVWISTALACAAIYWMLLAWLPAWWAILGGLLATVHPLILYWSQSYWGGSVAVIGGAVVFGALRRIMRRPRVRDALLMGLGLAVLANSRPYEGLLVSLPAAVLLFTWMIGKNGPAAQVSIKRVVLPVLSVLTLTGGAMGYYNWRVTGDPLRMPYQVHEATYAMAPLFLWQQPRPEPIYRHKVMRDGHMDDLKWYMQKRAAPFRWIFERWWNSRLRYLSYVLVLVVSLIMTPWILKDRWSRFALLTCGVLAAGLILETYFNLHYAAPVIGLLFVLILQAMRQLHVWQRRRQIGRVAVWTVLIICLTSFVLAFAQKMTDNSSGQMSPRARILAQLKATEERHLVIVRYGPQPPRFRDWVYNDADIDAAKVVWAREMDSAQNRKLLEYFKDRHAWLVEVGKNDSPPELVPYPRL
jgi:hypothetical protein